MLIRVKGSVFRVEGACEIARVRKRSGVYGLQTGDIPRERREAWALDAVALNVKRGAQESLHHNCKPWALNASHCLRVQHTTLGAKTIAPQAYTLPDGTTLDLGPERQVLRAAS